VLTRRARCPADNGNGLGTQDQLRNQISVMNAAFPDTFVFRLVSSEIVYNSAWCVPSCCRRLLLACYFRGCRRVCASLGWATPATAAAGLLPADGCHVQALLDCEWSHVCGYVSHNSFCEIYCACRSPLPYPSENYLAMKRALHVGGASDLNLWITPLNAGGTIGCASRFMSPQVTLLSGPPLVCRLAGNAHEPLATLLHCAISAPAAAMQHYSRLPNRGP